MNDMNCRSGPAVKKPKITPSTPLLPSFEGSQRLPERQTGRNWNASSAKSIPIEHPFSSVVPCRESCRYYLGFNRILRERRRGDHVRAILKKWEIREPDNQRWEKNEPTINLYRPRGMNPRGRPTEIQIACLESRAEILAFASEIDQVLEEGGVLQPSWGPKHVLANRKLQ